MTDNRRRGSNPQAGSGRYWEVLSGLHEAARRAGAYETCHRAIQAGNAGGVRRLLATWPVLAHSVDLLIAATESGREEILADLIAAGAPVGAADESGNTPLMIAAYFGHLGIVKRLIEAGADPDGPADERGSSGGRALHGLSALFQAISRGHRGVAAFLAPRTDPWLRIQAEVADPRPPSPADEALYDAVVAGEIDAVRAALDAGADIHARTGESRRTALHAAAAAGHADLVALLLDAGADADARDIYGQTSLWKAARDGNPKVACLLIDRGADVEAREFDGDQTPLMQAVLANQPEVVTELLSAGADPNATDADGLSALDYAEYQHVPEARSALQRAIDG